MTQSSSRTQWFFIRKSFIQSTGGRLLKPMLVCVGLVLAMIAAPLPAQVESGQIAGTVTDQSGAVVASATVVVTNVATGAQRQIQTSSTGAYVVTGLAAATYKVAVTTANFKPFTATAEVTVGGHVTLDAKLSVSSNITEVQVVGEGGVGVNTSSQEISQIVDTRQMAQLPSLTRNAYDFVAISGNVSGGDTNAGAASNGVGQNDSFYGVGYSMNGQRNTGTEILLDGMENIDLFGDVAGTKVPLDAVGEYRVLTSNFDPQYGRASGGIVNLVTKGGSNRIHGDAWEYNRVAAYTANTVYNAQNDLSKGDYTRNQFGFTVGGPIVKDKLFFFGATEWLRVRGTATISSAVPTSQLIALSAPNVQSYFSAYAGTQNFNFSQTYTAGQLGITGIPSTTPAFGTVTFNAPSDAGGGLPQNTYNTVLRGDYNLSSKTQMFIRNVYYHEVDQKGASFFSPYSQYDVGNLIKDQATLLSLTHEFNASVNTTGKVSFSRLISENSYDTSLQNTPTLAVSPNALLPGTSSHIQLPGFYDQNPAASGGLPYGGPQNAIQWNQDLGWIKSNHSMQYGAQLLYIQSNRAYGAYAQAAEQMANGGDVTTGLNNFITGDLFLFEAAVDPKGALPCVKNPYTGALTQTAGCTINLPASSPSFARSDRFHDWAGYGQDSWKVFPRFTFDYGARYEYYGVQHNNHKALDSNYYYGSGSNYFEQIRNGQVFTTPNSPIHEIWKPSYGTVSPRIGFAWDVFGDGRTSVRGGYGISYERNFGNVTFNTIQNPPNYGVVVVYNSTVQTSNAGPLGASSGSVPLPPTSLRNVDENIRTAQTQFWSLAVERQLAPNTVVTAQYVAARGTHLYDIKNINGQGSGNVFAGDPLCDGAGNCGLTRLNNQYSNINNRGSNGDSYYEGLNVGFQTSNWRNTGLSLVANYTYAHAIDDISSTFSGNNNDFNLGYTNPFNPALDRGNGDQDIRHRLVVAPIYEVPYFKNRHNLMGEAVGNWSLSGIFTVHTGVPINYYDSTYDYSGYNIPRYAPASGTVGHKSFKDGMSNMGGDFYMLGNLPPAASFYNPAFAPVVGGKGGISDWGPYPANMVGRNQFGGPGSWNLDAAVQKTFPITEGVNLVFRAEGFNALNHHNFYALMVDNDVALTGDGVPIPMYGAKGGVTGGPYDERRFGQFALKVDF